MDPSIGSGPGFGDGPDAGTDAAPRVSAVDASFPPAGAAEGRTAVPRTRDSRLGSAAGSGADGTAVPRTRDVRGGSGVGPGPGTPGGTAVPRTRDVRGGAGAGSGAGRRAAVPSTRGDGAGAVVTAASAVSAMMIFPPIVVVW